MGLVVSVIAWLFVDKRRLIVALAVAAVVAGGLTWVNTRPASRSAICAQAAEYRSHLESSSYQVFDNEFFSMAASLGKAASNPESAAGGDLASLRTAGQQLARVGGLRSANQGQVEGPLETVEAWCAAGAYSMAAGAPADGDVSGDQPVGDSVTEPEAADPPVSSIEATVDCASLVPDVQAAVSPDLELATMDWDGGPDMEGLLGFSYCGYGTAPQPGGSVDVSIEYARFQSPEQASTWLSSVVTDVPQEGSTGLGTSAFGGSAPVASAWTSWGDVYIVSGSTAVTDSQVVIDLLGHVRDATAHD